MGLVISRLNLENFHAFHTGRRRSQQDETMYSYSLNKNYFSNYFLMGGERFEVNDPDYLFGDNCDLNFLSCTKPYSLPYKQAQQYLLSNLNTKQKAINKVSSRVHRLSSPFSIITSRQRQEPSLRKQDAQTQTLHSSKGLTGSEPSKPLVMFVNIRKETLRLVKSPNPPTVDSDQNDSNSLSTADLKCVIKLIRKRSSLKNSKRCLHQQTSTRHSASSSRATIATIYPNEGVEEGNLVTSNSSSRNFESDVSSLLTATSSTRSGYTSVKETGISDDSSEENDDDFKDALNDTTNLSLKEDDDDDESEKTQQQRSLLNETTKSTKETRDTKITNRQPDDTSASSSSDNKEIRAENLKDEHEACKEYSKQGLRSSPKRLTRQPSTKTTEIELENTSNRVYNIEFNFDAEVDCSIRIYYSCTRELTSTGITYKPQHPTYRSQLYYYKKGLNQKFDQPEHTFQPYLFDEDLLIYKPLDLDGNYNLGALFPIVIHCVASEGPCPRQSQSLVATIEKSQLDDSYSIKPLKQLIFVDGVQYILQDIYGIEHKELTSQSNSRSRGSKNAVGSSTISRGKSHSMQSNLNESNLNISDTTSLTSMDSSLNTRQNRGSFTSTNRHKSLARENVFECVICMSEERDTILLPCRHLCLCSSCAQSLRYQASSCPICRCPFKAALNLRPIQRRKLSHSLVSSSSPSVSTSLSATRSSNQDPNTQAALDRQ